MELKKLPNEKWLCSYYVGPQQRRVRGVNKKQLVEQANKEIYEWNQRRITPELYKQTITFEEQCDKYLALYAIPNNQVEDKYYTPYFIEFLGAKTKLNEIDVEKLSELKAKMVLEMAPATVIRRWCLLNNIFREAINYGYLAKSPCKGVGLKSLRKKASRKNTARQRWFTNEETQQIYEECQRVRENDHYTPEQREENLLYAVIARNTGLRPISQQKLEWHDLNFKDNTFSARETKNGHTYIMPMNTAARKAFLRLWEMKGKPQQGGKVFRRSNWTQVFKKVLRRLGWNDSHLPKEQQKINSRDQACLYSFRHTFASHLVMNGYAGKPLWDLMGWENGSEEATYAHLSPKFKETMANVVSCDFTALATGEQLLQEAKGN